MRPKQSIRVTAAFALLFAILACNGQATPEAVREDNPTPPPPPAEPPPEPATATLLPPPTPTDEPLPTASPLPTAIQKPTATKTQPPPLPDFDDVLTFGGGAGGGIRAREFCQSHFPGVFPASYGETSSVWIDQIAYLCIWGVPLDVVFQVELISPKAEITITGTFKALSSNHTVSWSGHVPDEHDSVVYIQNGVTTAVISPWWPKELPKGIWNMHVTWPGKEVYGTFNASGNTASQLGPNIFTTDPRIKSEILPSGVIEQRLVHPGNADKVFGTGFSPSSIVYLLAYADEQKGVYNPTWERFVFVTGVPVLTDNDGNFNANLPVDFEQGRLYMLLAVTNPNADLSLSTGEMIYDEIEAEELFYIQPSAPTFDFIPVSSSCPGAPPQRMVINQRGYVCTKGDNVRLRNAPKRSGAALDSLPVGTQFTVLGGPSCADNWSWWQIRTDYGVTGWIAEGGDEIDPYFICPLP